MKQIPCNMMMKGPQKDLFKQEMIYDEPQLVSWCVLNKIVSLLKVTLVVFSILEKKTKEKKKRPPPFECSSLLCVFLESAAAKTEL